MNFLADLIRSADRATDLARIALQFKFCAGFKPPLKPVVVVAAEVENDHRKEWLVGRY
jgi:hypothetical protein